MPLWRASWLGFCFLGLLDSIGSAVPLMVRPSQKQVDIIGYNNNTASRTGEILTS
jgi:hypothetical protein